MIMSSHPTVSGGTPISKLTDIPILNISAIKSTNTDITTSMDSSLLLLQMLQIIIILFIII